RLGGGGSGEILEKKCWLLWAPVAYPRQSGGSKRRRYRGAPIPRALLPGPYLVGQNRRPNVVRSERCGLASIPMLAVPERAHRCCEDLRGHLQLPLAIWQLVANVPVAAHAPRAATLPRSQVG